MKQVTLKDISQKAGIAISEVSRVLNNKPSWLSETNRNKILKISQELHYRPNRFAQSLKTGSVGQYPGLHPFNRPQYVVLRWKKVRRTMPGC